MIYEAGQIMKSSTRGNVSPRENKNNTNNKRRCIMSELAYVSMQELKEAAKVPSYEQIRLSQITTSLNLDLQKEQQDKLKLIIRSIYRDGYRDYVDSVKTF